jgi:hypothetical protein
VSSYFPPNTNQLSKEQEGVLVKIYNAFKDITLGFGIGLREGNGLDDFYTEEACADLRAVDEKEDWLAISVDDINEYWCGLSHLDPEGMRFYLPAFLKCDVEMQYKFDLIFTLTRIDDWGKNRFKLLNKIQKEAVAAYLVYMMDDPRTFERDIPVIQKALTEYWLLDPNDAA